MVCARKHGVNFNQFSMSRKTKTDEPMVSFDFKSHYERLEQAQSEAEVEELRRQFDEYWDALPLEALLQAREEFSAYLNEFNREQAIRIAYLKKILTAEAVA